MFCGLVAILALLVTVATPQAAARSSTVALADENGQVLERVTYDAYGAARLRRAGDLDGDGSTNSLDENILLSQFGPNVHIADLDFDGDVDAADQALLGASYGGPAPAGQLSLVDNVLGYAGYMFNAETQQYCVRNRTYDTITGRWLERDPAGYADGLSLYQYVMGNPTLLVDPFGLEGFWRGAWDIVQTAATPPIVLAAVWIGGGDPSGARFYESMWQTFASGGARDSVLGAMDGLVGALNPFGGGFTPNGFCPDNPDDYAHGAVIGEWAGKLMNLLMLANVIKSAPSLYKALLQQLENLPRLEMLWMQLTGANSWMPYGFSQLFVQGGQLVITLEQVETTVAGAIAGFNYWQAIFSQGSGVTSGGPGNAAGPSSTLLNFNNNVGQATEGVLGGFVQADGTVNFVPFTQNGLTGHTAAQAAGAIPADAVGGFSVSVQNGQIVSWNFQSALNTSSTRFALSPALQEQIKAALSTVTATGY